MSRRNKDKRNETKRTQVQNARGNYIAQASDHSRASINVYEAIMPHPIEPAVIEAAMLKLMSMPSDALPGTNSLSFNSRPPPYARNPLFVGREDELRTLATSFKKPAHATVIITSMGGMGKTQLAAEFVHRYGCYFAGGVFWLNFADSAGVPLEIAACCTAMQPELRLDIHTLPLDQQIKQVLAAWQSHLPRLLIFDNCEDEILFAQWRPPLGNCRILITSRREIWSKELDVIVQPLRKLPRAESITLLTKHRSELSPSSLDLIAQEVGDLPLALHLAGRYLDFYQDSHLGQPEAYLAALRKPTPLDHLSFKEEGITYDTGHIRHLARTFAASYERLDINAHVDQLAFMILACTVHFAPDEPIPRDFLRATIDLLKTGPSDQLEDLFVRALQRLGSLGLLEKHPGPAYQMHRLLTAFVRQHKAANDLQVQVAIEQVLKDRAERLHEEYNLDALRSLLPHLRSVVQEALQREDEEAAMLGYGLSKYLMTMGSYHEAEQFLLKVLRILEQVRGKKHFLTQVGMSSLAQLYYQQGKYKKAGPLFIEALAILVQYKQAMGKSILRKTGMEPSSHPDIKVLEIEVARIQGNLANLYIALWKYKEAELLLQEVLTVLQRVLGKRNLQTAGYLSNLAALYFQQEKYEEAEPLYQEVLEIHEQMQGKEHPEAARILGGLAALYFRQKKYEEANPLLLRALEIQKRTLGKEHPETILSMSNLGAFYFEVARYEEAEAILKEASAICQQVLGEENPETARSLNNLAAVYQAQEKYEEAELLFKEALTVYRRLGEKHPTTVILEHNYTLLQQKMQQQGRESS